MHTEKKSRGRYVDGVCCCGGGQGVEMAVSWGLGGLGFWSASQHSSRTEIIAGFDLEALNPNFLISF